MSVHLFLTGPSPAQQLVRRGLRLRRTGEARRALIAFREACAHDERCARTWTLYGVLCLELGRLANAQEALEHALWLRQQAHQTRRAEVLQALIARHGLERRCA